MAFTAALIGLGLTAAEAATIAGAAGTVAAGAGTAAAAAPVAAGALGAGAGAAGAGALGAAAAPAVASAIPAAAALAPEAAAVPAASALPIGPMMGSGAEAISGGGALGIGSGAAGSTSPFSAFFSPGGGASQGVDALKSFGSDRLSEMAPKNTTDYLKLGQMGNSMLGGGSQPAPAPAMPLQRPQGSAIPLGDPQRLRALTVQNGGGGGLDPRTMAILARLVGGRR